MILLTYDIRTATPFQNSSYRTEKERRNLLEQAKNDMRNSPGSSVCFVDITKDGIISGPVECE